MATAQAVPDSRARGGSLCIFWRLAWATAACSAGSSAASGWARQRIRAWLSLKAATRSARRIRRLSTSRPDQSWRARPVARASIRAARPRPAWRSAPASIQSATVSRASRASESATSARAAMRSARPDRRGIRRRVRSCRARTALVVSRRREVSNGKWMDRIWISLAAAARCRRSAAALALSRARRMSSAQRSASASQTSRRRRIASPTGWGKTRLWTRVAQPMPRPISITRVTAISNTAPGWLTAGNPMMAAV